MANPEDPRSRFTVLTGEWVSSPAWLDLPATVRIRAPEDRRLFARVRVSRTDVLKAARARRRQPIYEFWSVIHGKAPPVPHGIENADDGLTMLSEAGACFQGIRRPNAEDGLGRRTLAYVLKPQWFYVYELRPPVVLCRKEPVPAGLVFVAYVRLDEPSEGTVRGLLTHWHFVEADPAHPDLPTGFQERYDRRHW